MGAYGHMLHSLRPSEMPVLVPAHVGFGRWAQGPAQCFAHLLEYVFEKYLFEPTNSGIILYTLNAMKLFPNDGRIIASKILENISTLFKLSFFQSQKSNKTREGTKDMSLNHSF